jgi:hypothetical protein
VICIYNIVKVCRSLNDCSQGDCPGVNKILQPEQALEKGSVGNITKNEIQSDNLTVIIKLTIFSIANANNRIGVCLTVKTDITDGSSGRATDDPAFLLQLFVIISNFKRIY